MSSVGRKAGADLRVGSDLELYEADEYAWIEQQIAALRDGRLHDIDRKNLAEYLSDMAARDRRELGSRFTVLLQHLLEVRMQPARISPSWLNTITEQQEEIAKMFRETPSIAQHSERLFAEAYPSAVRRAAVETRIPAVRFPQESPWSIEDALALRPELPEPRASGRRRHT
ncbi:MAG: DUF29 domain-containing protein [Alphaproteobacteria bacterium]|nr:DUF29 domain-containing protein [Alphaproteobacteria bacterium]